MQQKNSQQSKIIGEQTNLVYQNNEGSGANEQTPWSQILILPPSSNIRHARIVIFD